MNSMTGYGKSVAESDGRKITVEMKSVNHRFLDVTVKLPKVLSFAEDAVRRVLIDNFKRGHFDVYVTYENTKNDGVELSVNEEVAKECLKIKDVLCDKYGVQDDFTVTALMRTADVIETKTVEEDEDALKFLIESATSGASEQMKKMRAFEGEKLRNDILKKVSVIESTVGEIRSMSANGRRVPRETERKNHGSVERRANRRSKASERSRFLFGQGVDRRRNHKAQLALRPFKEDA